MKKVLSLLTLLFTFIGNSNANIMPDTLQYPAEMIVMPVPEYQVATRASEDGNMKLYCWHSEDYSSEIQSGIICQFKTNDGETRSIRLHNVDGFNDGITNIWSLHSLQKEDGSTYYISVMEDNDYSGETGLWLNAFAIVGDTIKEVSVYDGSDDLDDCGMDVRYEYYDWLTRSQEEEWEIPFNYYPETKELYVPQAIDNMLTDRYYVYKFNGNEFVETGLQPHKGLHNDLCDYRRLLKCGNVRFHKFRIDELEDGKIRYASWDSHSKVSEKPDIILDNGEYDEEKNIYTFHNGNYHYIITEEEIIVKYMNNIQSRREILND